jgi:hypothetical protein
LFSELVKNVGTDRFQRCLVGDEATAPFDDDAFPHDLAKESGIMRMPFY